MRSNAIWVLLLSVLGLMLLLFVQVSERPGSDAPEERAFPAEVTAPVASENSNEAPPRSPGQAPPQADSQREPEPAAKDAPAPAMERLRAGLTQAPATTADPAAVYENLSDIEKKSWNQLEEDFDAFNATPEERRLVREVLHDENEAMDEVLGMIDDGVLRPSDFDSKLREIDAIARQRLRAILGEEREQKWRDLGKKGAEEFLRGKGWLDDAPSPREPRSRGGDDNPKQRR